MIVRYRVDDNRVKNYNPGKDGIIYSAKFIGGTPVLPQAGELVVFHNCPGENNGKPMLVELTCEVIGRPEHHMWTNGVPVENAAEMQAIVPVRLLKANGTPREEAQPI